MRVRFGDGGGGRDLEQKGCFQAEGHLPSAFPQLEWGREPVHSRTKQELVLKVVTSACLRLFI